MMAHPKWASENANVSVICVIFEIMFFFHFNCIAASGIFFLKSLSSARSVPTEYANKRHSAFKKLD